MTLRLTTAQADAVAEAIVHQIKQLDALSTKVVTDRDHLDIARQITDMVQLISSFSTQAVRPALDKDVIKRE